MCQRRITWGTVLSCSEAISFRVGSSRISACPRGEYAAIALEFVAHTDNHLDSEALERFLTTFQKTSPLLMGEIWALIITLRVVLLQHLTVRAMRLIFARNGRERGDILAERLFGFIAKPKVGEREIKDFLDNEIGDFGRLRRAFIVRLIHRLRDQDSDISPAFDWIENRLKDFSTNTEKLTQKELYIQASSQISIGNIISSMRLISSLDWKVFFERVNLIDPILREDKTGIYTKMDFTTRDRYRHSVESIAKNSRFTEIEVAKAAVSLEGHVGFHLIGDGMLEFKKMCLYAPPFTLRFLETILYYPTSFYLGTLTSATLLIVAPAIFHFVKSGGGIAFGVIFGLIALLVASELALSFINLYVSYFIKPQVLPRIDVEQGIPEEATTMVVVPTLLTCLESVKTLVERLEIHALANREKNIYFALLGDFADADQEHKADDKQILDFAVEKINNLNLRYCPNEPPLFHFFHRKRLWNSHEGKWMGWERKRGKISEFNKLLRGATDTSYIQASASEEFLSKVQYIITLDSDTELPRGAARKLISTIIHPLNRPIIDPVSRRVTSGYGILQPRISVTNSSALQTIFAKISSGNIGIDPYTTAVSDVYQDLFREGSFTGKGLYVVDVFEEVMDGRAPDNIILSHDLFEGSFARCALVSDIELFDDYPADYDTFAKRGHRWVRGDWQISLWVLPWVLNSQRKWVKNDLSFISRWKIFDNLRRSLVPVAAIIWLFLAWTLLPGHPLFWTILVVLIFLFPVYAPFATGQWRQRGGVTWQGHILSGLRETKMKLAQIFLTVAFLPIQAGLQFDAVCRSLYRLIVSKKRLLEWNPFLQKKGDLKHKISRKDLLNPSISISLFMGVIIFFARPDALSIYFPFFLLWLLNPVVRQFLLKNPTKKEAELELKEIKEFRFYARSTWHFFERFVTEKGNWLAPDNFQEDPEPVVAYRTSPTNIGLQFLSYISAYDFGYIGRHEIVEQFERIFRSLEKLPREHGHFFNWYDIEFLTPLRPCYISTVDSGNLAGHLLALKQFLLQVSSSKRKYNLLRQGLEDTLAFLFERIENVKSFNSQEDHLQILKSVEQLLYRVKDLRIENEKQWRQSLEELSSNVLEIHRQLELHLESERIHKIVEISKRLLVQITELHRDLNADLSKLTNREAILVEKCAQMFSEMDFSFLFDDKRKLFTIGYNVEENEFDSSYYDLLASESRLASFVAIAKGDVPLEHWFRLGRQLASVKGVRALTSWSASMFEYLMPILVMKSYEENLLDQTYRSVVKRQIEYGKEQSVPWGVSESAYNARDLQMNYQYGPFGVPGLGLKRGLSNELVVSPYSTMLAAMIVPRQALSNLRKLKSLGGFSDYGFYESFDYTVERLPEGKNFAVIHSYMAHHQGMSFVSLNNLINKNIMQKRFHSETSVMATELLLQERTPKDVELAMPRKEEVEHSGFLHSTRDYFPREYYDVNLSLPRTQVLSNGTYSLLLTSAGSGYSRFGKFSVTRWREDSTRDHWGQYYYIHDLNSGDYWSATYQPIGKSPRKFGSVFSEDSVRFWRNDKNIVTKTEIVVSPEDSVELRKITLINESQSPQELELTSFMELALARFNDDNAHPSFSKLFIQTELAPNQNALLATRRRRSSEQEELWAFHTIACSLPFPGTVEYETDRSLFVGRGHTPRNPAALENYKPLSNTVGSVLDPIFSLRKKVTVPAGKSVKVVFSTGMVEDKSLALELVDKYSDFYTFERESEMAWTQAQVQLRHLKTDTLKAHLYQKLAGRVLYLDGSLRPNSQIISQNKRTQIDLWPYGVSGDFPLILIEMNDEKDISLFKDLLHAHEYMRLKGIVVDLVVLNLSSSSYLQSLQDELTRQVRMSGCQGLLNKHGGIFLLRSDLMPREDVLLFRSIARAVFKGSLGYLEEQLRHRKPRSEMPSYFKAEMEVPEYENYELKLPKLNFYNGLGGFSEETNEYVIGLEGENSWTPAPWINVIANSLDFGFIVSESGAAHTWSMNSRENRITPWSNDPVSDPSGEIIYIRDEQTGELWSPTPLPIRDDGPYLIRHGQGYSQFQHISHEIEQTLNVFVALNDQVKISELCLKNLGTRTRYLSVTSYVEWVLGVHRESSAANVITEYDTSTNAIFARNSYNNEFASRISFSYMGPLSSEETHSFTCDRREFLGRNGDLDKPLGLKRVRLSNTFGTGLDPCCALQSVVELKPGQEETIVVLLGQTESRTQARELINTYGHKAASKKTFQAVISFWGTTLGRIQIKTPDESMNTLVNRWLPYQTLSCRLWGRTAFYQSGGANGFRDQLQDAMAMIHLKPEVTRKQILIHAARQFKEGDVQHWWHPPTGRGVRTHFSDDLLWLPFVVNFYLKMTEDYSILDEQIHFIEGPELEQHQEDAYIFPDISEEKGSLYEHCARALDRSLKLGIHGLPLIGCGDWNDGMNRVGHKGKGESVWVGWFLHFTLSEFLPLCKRFGENQREAIYSEHINKLKLAIEEEAWDGRWYRRAFFDDGTPLGSNSNDECKIDSISQSWAILSKAGDKDRAYQAMDAVEKRLINWEDKLVKLFSPAFDKTEEDPGYIKGYVPGVRENGGQYTHAAIWTLMAYAQLGDGEKATKLYQLLNPINHCLDFESMSKYKVEPYVMAADVYGVEPHVGRGGWTWYTGSSSWMYRSALESILGLERRSNKIKVDPKVPNSWDGFSIVYYYGQSRYEIILKRGDSSLKYKADEWIEIVDDEHEHLIEIYF